MEFTVPPVPPGLGTLVPAMGPTMEAVGEEITSPLWVATDEFGTVAQTEEHFVLFYPLRYHGGFTAITKGTEIEKVSELTVEPVALDKIELAAQLTNVLDVEVFEPDKVDSLLEASP